MSSSVQPCDLERAFRRVHQDRMRDVPLLNEALEVAAVGFRCWQDFQVGVLLTPWFMNLILLPPERNGWPELAVGEGRPYEFPSGSYDFLLGEQAGIGRYLCCSLFSPVLEFANQEAAVATAEEIMRLLFEGEPEVAPVAMEEPEPAETLPEPQPEAMTDPEAGRDTALSRRGFLRGSFLGEGR